MRNRWVERLSAALQSFSSSCRRGLSALSDNFPQSFFFFSMSGASCRWTCLRKRTAAVSALAVAGQAGRMDVSLIDTDKRETRRANRPRNPKVSLLTAVSFLPTAPSSSFLFFLHHPEVFRSPLMSRWFAGQIGFYSRSSQCVNNL